MKNYNVTNSQDFGEGSLREAIKLANESPGKDTVFVQSDVQLTSAIDITDTVEIGTPYGVTIEQTGNDRIFNIDDGTENDLEVSLFRLTFSNGNSNSPGGAIANSENLTIADSRFENNSAIDYGGAIYSERGNLDISRSEIVDNLVLGNENLSNFESGIYVDDTSALVSNDLIIENNYGLAESGDTLAGADKPDSFDGNSRSYYDFALLTIETVCSYFADLSNTTVDMTEADTILEDILANISDSF